MTDEPRFDARLRSALQELPRPSEGDTNHALDEVLRRSRRATPQVWVPVVAAAVVALIIGLVVALPVRSDRRHTIAPAENTATSAQSPEGVWRRDVRGAQDSSWDGPWTMTLQPNGVLLLEPPAGASNVTDGAAYAVSGGQFRMDAFVNGVCPDMAPGVYRWSRSGNQLTLVTVTEPCSVRADLFTGTWARTGP